MAEALALDLQNKRNLNRVQHKARSVNDDPYAQSKADPYALPQTDPYAQSRTDPYALPKTNPYAQNNNSGSSLAQKTARGAQAAGSGLQAGGAGMELAGKGAEMAGRGAQAAGGAIGSGIGAGIGGAIGGIGGAIAGSVIPGAGTLAGAAAGARAGAATGAEIGRPLGQLPGQAMQAGGKGMETAGRGMKQAGRGIRDKAKTFNQILQLARKDRDSKQQGLGQAVGDFVQQPSATVLKLAWLNIYWIIPYIYLLIHFIAAYFMPFGDKLFCKFGEEWVPKSIKIKGGQVAKRMAKEIELVEIGAFLFVTFIIALIILVILATCGFLAYAWENPLETLRMMTPGVAWEIIKCFTNGFFGLGDPGQCGGQSASYQQQYESGSRESGSTPITVPSTAGSNTPAKSGTAGSATPAANSPTNFK